MSSKVGARKAEVMCCGLTLLGIALLFVAPWIPQIWWEGDIVIGDMTLSAYVQTVLLSAWIWTVMLVIVAYLGTHLPTPPHLRRRYLFVLFAFVVLLLPFHKQVPNIGAATLSVVGLALYAYGVRHWRGAHRVVAPLGHALQKILAIRPSSFVVGVYAFFFIEALWLSWHCFSLLPAYDDSIAQYIHGKFLAAGKLYGKSPALREFFPVWMMVNHGKWYAQYQPLHESLLALGHLIDAPWIINPLEGALTVVLIYLLGRRVFGEGTARIAAALALVCPFMLFISAEYMNHASALLVSALMLYCYIAMNDALAAHPKRAMWWGAAAGLSLGALFLTRPLDAVGLGLPFAIDIIVRLRGGWRLYLRPIGAMALATLICVLVDLWFNMELTGNALVFPTGKYHGGSNISAMGYNADFTLWQTLIKAQDEWARLNRQMFEWTLPSSFFAMIYCLFPVRNHYAKLMLGIIAAHTLVNLLNQFSSTVFGPRYLYQIAACLILLSAAGIARIPVWLRTWPTGGPLSVPVARGMVALPILVLVLVMAGEAMPRIIKNYTHFFQNHPDFYESMLVQSKKPALIFIGRDEDAGKKTRWLSFTYPPRQRNNVIFAMDRGDDEDRELINYYPGRHVYIESKGVLTPFPGRP